MTFQQTLTAHLNAITTRDYAAFVATVTQGDELTLILPTGKLLSSRAEVLDFMANWFADPDWQIQFEPVRTVETAEMGMALLLVNYTDRDLDGQPYALRYYLNLLFANEAGVWRLVHDQNTLV
jgi:ketosteroid isomerase-like protein